jgi:chemotaxis protein CheX
MSNSIDVQFIKPFVDGAIETLKVQCSLEAKPGKPYFKGREGSPQTQVDIAGIIGLTSEAFQGTISLCFSEKTFLGIMGKMLGENYEQLTKEVEDGAGELINIIFGAAKRVLNERGYAIQKALPSVVRGKDMSVHHLTPIPIVVLPFETALGAFQIEVGIEPLIKGE